MSKRPEQKAGWFKTRVQSWLGLGAEYEEQWRDLITRTGATSVAGVTVNEDGMLALSACWACVRLISETIATLPLGMYERTSSGKRYAPEHPLHGIIHDFPNPDTTSAVHWESTVAAMMLRGNARAEKLMIGERIVGLNYLAPSRLSARRSSTGLLEYLYTDLNGRQRTIPASSVFVVPGFSLNGYDGVSVVQYGAQVFGSATAAEQAAAATFANGLMPATYFKMAEILTPAQRLEFRENLEELAGSLNAGKTPLLEGGMEVGDVGINPDDAQLLQSRGFSVEEVCRWFRVPPWMIGHTEKSTSWGTGIESQMIGFLVFTIGPWLRRIEQAIAKDLMLPADRSRFYPKFAVEGLLRADSAARAAFYSVMVDKGILTRDEVRELEEREPMGGNAAVLTVQSQMIPLDAIGQTTDDAQARTALRAFLGFDDKPEQSKQ